MKKIGYYIVLVLSFIWQLPQNLIAIIMLPFLGKLRFVEKRYYQYVFEGENMRGGISLGNFAFLSPNLIKKQQYIEHELGHGIDSKRMGPLYLFIVGIPSILHAWLHNNCPCYYHFYCETWANNNIGTVKVVYTTNGCYLDMKK